MTTDKESTYAAARRTSILGWIVFLGLIGLTVYRYVPPSVPFFVGTIWAVIFYNRFTQPPEDIVDASLIVKFWGAVIIFLSGYVIYAGSREYLLLDDIRSTCNDVTEERDTRSDICNEVREKIDAYYEAPTFEDFEPGT